MQDSANAIPLGERASPSIPRRDGVVFERGATQITDAFDVSKLDSTLQNKNKRRGFARGMESKTPQRIVFEDLGANTGTEGAGPRPRLIRPSEHAQNGRLPGNLFVTTVDVEGYDGSWNRKNKKKQKDDYEQNELEEEMVADVTLDYGSPNIHDVEVTSKSMGITANMWRDIEVKWRHGSYQDVIDATVLSIDDIIGFWVSSSVQIIGSIVLMA